MPRVTKTTAEILKVAEQICAESGPSGIRIDEIARRIGIRPPSIYSHYSGIEKIINELTKTAFVTLGKTYENIDTTMPTLEALALTQKRQIDLLVARPGIARLVLTDLAQPGGFKAVEANLEGISNIVAQEQKLFLRGVQNGDFRAVDFELWYATRLGALYFALSFEWLKKKNISRQRKQTIAQFLAERESYFLIDAAPAD